MAKILIVEDSDEVRNDLRTYLASQGFEIIEAIDGKAGLEQCMKNQNIDVIVTDQNMPAMTGLEMVRALRSDSRYKSTHVIFHTTESKQELRSQGQELGIKGWLVKPINPENMNRLLNRLLSSAPRVA